MFSRAATGFTEWNQCKIEFVNRTVDICIRCLCLCRDQGKVYRSLCREQGKVYNSLCRDQGRVYDSLLVYWV